VRKGQRTNQKYQNPVGSDQQTQKLENTELRKADRTVGTTGNTSAVRRLMDFMLSAKKVGNLVPRVPSLPGESTRVSENSIKERTLGTRLESG